MTKSITAPTASHPLVDSMFIKSILVTAAKIICTLMLKILLALKYLS